MRGLWLKDCYSIKMYARQYLLLLVFFMIFGISMGNSHYIMWMSLVLGLNLGFAVFPADESGGYGYMLAAPVSRQMIVQVRYLFGLAAGFLMFLCSGAGEIINRMLSQKPTEFWLGEMAIVLGVYLIFVSVLTPVSYRFGVEKARLVMLGLVAVPVVIVFLGVKLIQISVITDALDKMFPQTQMMAYGGAFAFLGVGLLVMGISYRLSVWIFERREF